MYFVTFLSFSEWQNLWQYQVLWWLSMYPTAKSLVLWPKGQFSVWAFLPPLALALLLLRLSGTLLERHCFWVHHNLLLEYFEFGKYNLSHANWRVFEIGKIWIFSGLLFLFAFSDSLWTILQNKSSVIWKPCRRR